MRVHPIKAAIDAACLKHGITHSAIAKNADVARETLYRIMRGDAQRASVKKICAIARAAQMAPIALLRLVYHDIDVGPATALPVLTPGDHTAFVSDLTMPDGSAVMAGQRFKKVWRIQNTGDVQWTDRKLRCFDSELVVARWEKRGSRRVLVEEFSPRLIPIRREVAIAATAPGHTVEIAVTFKAPELPSDTISRWKMVDATGALCFPEHSGLWCAVSVVVI